LETLISILNPERDLFIIVSMSKRKAKKEKAKVSVTQKELNWWEALQKKDFFRSGLFYVLLFLFVFGLAIFLRLLYLTSDPPSVSWSQDLTTDAPAYTSFARSKILWGEWNLFGQQRFVLWVNSAFTLVSFLFFKLTGVGRAQANLAAVFFNFMTIFFIYLAVKKAVSKNTALLCSFFLGINYIFLIYGRSTFSEISTLFFIALGFYFFVLGLEKNIFLIFSGGAHACAFLFGKMLGLFILPVCLGILILMAFEDFSKQSKKVKLSPLAFFSIGFLGCYLPWYLLIYASVPSEVKLYLKDQSVGLYGAPMAFKSIKDFIYSLYSFGYTSGVFSGAPYRAGVDLFYRMPFVFLLSCIFLIFYFFNIFKGKFLEKIKSASKMEIYLILWLIIGFLALMPWNYRPLRYQLLIIPPFCVLAGIMLSRFLRSPSSLKKEKLNWVYWIFFLPLSSLSIFHLLTFFLKLFGKTGSFNLLALLSILLAMGSIILWHAFFKNKPFLKSKAYSFKSVVVSITVFLIFLININQYLSWAKNPQYTLIRSSQDLGKILNKDAVLSGPYAPPLTLDNNLALSWHQFTLRADPMLFKKYPITHLALESQGGNKQRAFQDYPEVMQDAQLVTTYILRGMPVEIYRVKGNTGNPQAQSYQLSDFEKAQVLIQEEKTDSAIVLLNQFNQKNPENLSAHIILSNILSQKGDYQKAISELEKAIQFDEKNFLLYYYLGFIYLQLSNLQKNPIHWQRGIEAWEKSLKLNPQNIQLAEQLKKIKGY
jgi:4-amino-4-deoxy-L-arabinose transferase-like glycosyltransferase